MKPSEGQRVQMELATIAELEASSARPRLLHHNDSSTALPAVALGCATKRSCFILTDQHTMDRPCKLLPHLQKRRMKCMKLS